MPSYLWLYFVKLGCNHVFLKRNKMSCIYIVIYCNIVSSNFLSYDTRERIRGHRCCSCRQFQESLNNLSKLSIFSKAAFDLVYYRCYACFRRYFWSRVYQRTEEAEFAQLTDSCKTEFTLSRRNQTQRIVSYFYYYSFFHSLYFIFKN